jgi:hypothetical protein
LGGGGSGRSRRRLRGRDGTRSRWRCWKDEARFGEDDLLDLGSLLHVGDDAAIFALLADEADEEDSKDGDWNDGIERFEYGHELNIFRIQSVRYEQAYEERARKQTQPRSSSKCAQTIDADRQKKEHIGKIVESRELNKSIPCGGGWNDAKNLPSQWELEDGTP